MYKSFCFHFLKSSLSNVPTQICRYKVVITGEFLKTKFLLMPNVIIFPGELRCLNAKKKGVRGKREGENQGCRKYENL